MPLGLAFWIVALFTLLVWIGGWFWPPLHGGIWPAVPWVLLLLMVLILGWHNFGPPIR